jgi:PA14 domain
VVWAAAGSGDQAEVLINAPVNFGEQLPERLFFPPVVPPKPPKIISVTPIVLPDAPPVQLPYDADAAKPSVREGQQFKLVVELYGSAEVRAQPLTLSIDGRKIEYTPDTELHEEEKSLEGTEKRWLICTLPTGCGEGKMAARLSIVQSDPFYIDVTNKGLITYLYDFPNGGGYTQLPEFGPLACFKVRKDGQINFENANFLNLPFPAETFGIEYYGGIIIETEGDYVFTGRSDDGIRVWVNGQEACVDDNLHYQREKAGEPLHLVPGVYTFKAEFFENNVHEVFVLYFEAKDAQGKVILPKQVIPKRQFTWDVHPPLPDKSSTGKLADGTAPQG